MTHDQLTLVETEIDYAHATTRITLSAVWVTLQVCFPITCPTERSEIPIDCNLLFTDHVNHRYARPKVRDLLAPRSGASEKSHANDLVARAHGTRECTYARIYSRVPYARYMIYLSRIFHNRPRRNSC